MNCRVFLTLLLCLFVCVIFPAGAEHFGIHFPLKASADEGPYDDDKFLEIADTLIGELSGKTLPTTGSDLLNLMSAEMQLSQMNISPEFFPVASDINAYLYYLSKAGQEYEEEDTLTRSWYSPVSTSGNTYGEANAYYEDAISVWLKIQEKFPDASVPDMPVPAEPTRITSYSLIP